VSLLVGRRTIVLQGNARVPLELLLPLWVQYIDENRNEGEPIRARSMTNLKEKLIKICAKVISHGRYVAFQMAEVAIPRHLFAGILRLIAELQPPPDPSPS
jgi:hypothetical protein